jgi:hypothetical protein
MSTAHLVIHADSDLTSWRTHMQTTFWRIAVLLNTKNRSDAHQPFIDLPLQPGTYHVKTQTGRIQRCFTLTLKKDARFDLFLYRGAERGAG